MSKKVKDAGCGLLLLIYLFGIVPSYWFLEADMKRRVPRRWTNGDAVICGMLSVGWPLSVSLALAADWMQKEAN